MTDKQSSMVVVSREWLEKALKADASQGATAWELHDGWLAMKVLRAQLAAPVEQQGEPVAYVDSSCLRNLKMSGFESYSALLHSTQADILSPQRIALYRHAQPPAKVSLPEHKGGQNSAHFGTYDYGWNACLDEVAKLNPSK